MAAQPATKQSGGAPKRVIAPPVIVGGREFPTLLKAFMVSRGLVHLQLAEASGISRQQLGRIKAARAEPTRPMIKSITRACRELAREALRAGDLFDIDVGTPTWTATAAFKKKKKRR